MSETRRQCRMTEIATGKHEPGGWYDCSHKRDEDCWATDPIGFRSDHRLVDKDGYVVVPGPTPSATATGTEAVAFEDWKPGDVFSWGSGHAWHNCTVTGRNRYNSVVAKAPDGAVGTFDSGMMSEATLVSRAAAVSPPKPPTFRKREVSCDGKNWTDYDRLVDADPFEAYKWQRELNAAGFVVSESGPVAVDPRWKIKGKYGPRPAGERDEQPPRSEYIRRTPWTPSIGEDCLLPDVQS